MGTGAEKVKKLLQTARIQIQQGERKEALETYRKALKLDPENHQIMDRINIVEREIAAMEKFNKSRFSRAHSAGRNISSSGFVDDCIKRSNEAFKADDAVRALQELERATRHDPDNALVKKKIAFVRCSIKVDGFADMVRSRIDSGDPRSAIENIREIFNLLPAASVIDELLKMVEDYRGEVAAVIETTVPVVDKVKEKKEKVVVASTAKTPVKTQPGKIKEEKKTEKKREQKKKKKPVAVAGGKAGGDGQKKMLTIIGAVVLLVIIVFAITKVFSGREPEPEIIEDVPTLPFTETIVVLGAEDVNLALDGVSVDAGLPGIFILSDTIFTQRIIVVSSLGFENLTWSTVFEEGLIRTDTLYLDSIGTTMIQVTFGYVMPAGEDDPGPEAVSFMVDGEIIEGNTDSIPTGEHVFQVILDGYRTMPESVLVVDPVDLNQTMNILASEQSQITLQLAAGTPGNAIFYVDGERVASGRRMTQVLPFGSYYLQVQMEGRQDFGVTITLEEDGYSRTISLEEIVETGQLMVGPEPWSDVYVDGGHVGTTPFRGVELEPGTYTVRLSNPDFRDDTHTVEITAGETTAIQYNAVAVGGPDEVHTDTATVVEPIEDLPISSPFAIRQTAPSVPSQAKARGDLHGYVTLAVAVGADGSVQNVTVVSDPLGLGCGQAAVDAVRAWIFSPAMQGGQPVEVTTNVQIRFDIE
ncbi:MAG: TonB family protein [Candidatus Aegiribacteria sp.]|nr:TonB family protein [Candidatus Aegiribacteria sp.]